MGDSSYLNIVSGRDSRDTAPHVPCPSLHAVSREGSRYVIEDVNDELGSG